MALTIDEGIAGYRDDTIQAAKAIARQLGVEQHVVSFQEKYGSSLDRMVSRESVVAPCTYCGGVFRKHALNRAARNLGADKIATGHNLDDEAQTVMMNYLKGDLERLMRLRPRRAQKGAGAPHQAPKDDAGKGDRPLLHGQRNILSVAGVPLCQPIPAGRGAGYDEHPESQSPGTKLSTVKGFESLDQRMKGDWAQMDLAACRKCGDPCVGERCKACQLLEEIK